MLPNGTSPSRFIVSTKKKMLHTYLMKRSVWTPRAGSATSLRRYWQTTSTAPTKPDETSLSSPSPVRRDLRTIQGMNRQRRTPARTIMAMWSLSRVMTPLGVSGPASQGTSFSGC